ncbi:hypothetical protein ACFLY7_02330 [Patescibacteria group bacterium]
MTTKTLTNILIGVVVLAGVYYGYGFWKDRQTEPLLVVSQEASPSLEIGRDLLSTLFQLGSLKLDEDIFKDSIFRGLKDFSVSLKAQPSGRTNPFAPIGSDSSSGVSQEDIGSGGENIEA